MKTKAWKCPAKTKRILERVKKLITDVPQRLDMNDVATRSTTSDHACGTVACIAGWTFLTAAPKDEIKLVSSFLLDADKPLPSDPDEHIYSSLGQEQLNRAAELLSLTEEQLESLFFFQGWRNSDYGWPIAYQERYEEAEGYDAAERAAVTCEVIDLFIKTGALTPEWRS